MHAPTILLVEDNQLLRWWLASSLKDEGFEVTAPRSIDESVALADRVPFDLLITDWRLADGHDGLEMLQRARKTDSETLAVLISAETTADFSERARQDGFDIVIEKPFPVAQIVDAVHSLEERFPARVAS